MPRNEPPTVDERQRVERLLISVASGTDPGAAVEGVTLRLGLAVAAMLGEAAAAAFARTSGMIFSLGDPAYRRYLALEDVFRAMLQEVGVPKDR